MNVTEFATLVLDQLPFEPTDQQIQLVAALSRFCSAATPADSVFLLNGYAGTGKTSVMGALVRTLQATGVHTVLLASTGRAAKVFGAFTGMPAHTIHRKIYRTPGLGPDGIMEARLCPNPHINTVFIVDEASMIGDDGTGASSLLHDLIMYVYTGINCRLILLGDTAQLPPVGLSGSPAMDPLKLKEMGLRVTRAVMTRTVRQKRRSGILYNATALRRALRQNPLPEPVLTASRFSDVGIVEPDELEEVLGSSFSRYGEGETIVITRSNRRAVDFNLAIRRTIFDREEVMVRGERLL
ncbi:MAG: AAA family ATPase, partial [Muribaculaceae bacterium]|nr:AAA family ATPase [Muribaculaceae bacterium]